MQALLSTTYFGPVQWYQKLCRYDDVLIERHDTYRKQTYRNRCVIATTGGTQTLTVPVDRGGGGQRLQTKDVRISDHGNWRRLHWHALMTAYSESPFFEYYADDIRPFFERRWEFLYDLNTDICLKMCELLNIPARFRPTGSFVPPAPAPPVSDFRDSIDPKHPAPDDGFHPRRYYQVFERKHGFLPNLSVLDLLFNMGPEGIFWLM